MTPPHACLAAGNDNAARDTTLGDVLIERARRTPFRVAVDGALGRPPRCWTWEALRDDAAVLSVALLSRYEPGERIAVWAPPCPEVVLLKFAAAFAGLVLVTIDPAWRAADLPEILDESGSVGLFVMSGGHGRRASRATGRAPRFLREIVDLADWRTLFAKHGCVDGLPEVRPDDPAEICYPAGQAGSPGGETILHRDLAAALRGDHDGAAFWIGPTPALA